MTTIANNTARDSMYGTVYHVGLVAFLSTVDVATDIYVISTYYRIDELVSQANAMLSMIATNLFFQLVFLMLNYKKKSTTEKLKEVALSIFFLRPIVDAYRVATAKEDGDVSFDPLNEMICKKVCELSAESIPGCVLQLHVWLQNPEEAGKLALSSIAVSALTTGYASAMIAFDYDVDLVHRQSQPKFYGYIPDDNGLRGRCFVLMTVISALHNVSRSMGVALLASSTDCKALVAKFIGGEILLCLVFKVCRRDFYYWPKLDPLTAILLGFLSRAIVKVVVDFCGSIHYR